MAQRAKARLIHDSCNTCYANLSNVQMRLLPNQRALANPNIPDSSSSSPHLTLFKLFDLDLPVPPSSLSTPPSMLLSPRLLCLSHKGFSYEFQISRVGSVS